MWIKGLLLSLALMLMLGFSLGCEGEEHAPMEEEPGAEEPAEPGEDPNAEPEGDEEPEF